MTSTPIPAAAVRPPRPQPGRGRRPSRPLSLLALPGLLGLLLIVLLAACSGSATPSGVASLVDPSASPDASPAPSVDPEAAMLAFTDCMREHGIDIQVAVVGEDGGGPVKSTTKGNDDRTGPGAFDKDELAAAEQACKSLLPQGGVNGPGGEIDPEFQDKMLAFAKCMREHGIDMPDPEFGTGGNTVTIGLGEDDGGPRIDPQSQEFKDAEEACGSFLPGKLGGPGTGGVTQVKP